MVPIIFACLVITGASTERIELDKKAKCDQTRVKKINSFTDHGHFEYATKGKKVDQVVQERIEQQIKKERVVSLMQKTAVETK